MKKISKPSNLKEPFLKRWLKNREPVVYSTIETFRLLRLLGKITDMESKIDLNQAPGSEGDILQGFPTGTIILSNERRGQ